MYEINDELAMYVIRGDKTNQVLMKLSGEDLEDVFSMDYPTFIPRGDLLILDNADLVWSDDVTTTEKPQS